MFKDVWSRKKAVLKFNSACCLPRMGLRRLQQHRGRRWLPLPSSLSHILTVQDTMREMRLGHCSSCTTMAWVEYHDQVQHTGENDLFGFYFQVTAHPAGEIKAGIQAADHIAPTRGTRINICASVLLAFFTLIHQSRTQSMKWSLPQPRWLFLQ